MSPTTTTSIPAHQARHFIVQPGGAVREFSPEEAAGIVAGSERLPEYAACRLKYLQVQWDVSDEGDSIKVQTAGASLAFDDEGKFTGASAPEAAERITRFEHDTCVQYALRDLPVPGMTQH